MGAREAEKVAQAPESLWLPSPKMGAKLQAERYGGQWRSARAELENSARFHNWR